MTAKTSTHTDLRPIEWAPVNLIPQPEVIEDASPESWALWDAAKRLQDAS